MDDRSCRDARRCRAGCARGAASARNTNCAARDAHDQPEVGVALRRPPHRDLAAIGRQGGIDLRGIGGPQRAERLARPIEPRQLLYGTAFPKTGVDLWVLPMAGDPKPWSFLNSTFNERTGSFSPDGHWVAYESNESGRSEVYVRPFPGPGGQWQVSTAGGKDPRWRPDGKELYDIAPDSRLMAAPIASSGTALPPGLPTALFQPRIVGGGTAVIGPRQQYDVAPDGRFLINVNVDEGTAAPITNWNPEAKK